MGTQISLGQTQPSIKVREARLPVDAQVRGDPERGGLMTGLSKSMKITEPVLHSMPPGSKLQKSLFR
ncbi:hypothetical protein AKJ43_02780 [candidate division MSBL1 archaeon SCGC-AAA261D19]|uniref:Uncharacterized protein n=1 Tax=candidate division MSBL1 archaeon SCGC-AAA261D19 TaxID=1698273 RepID=A0A133V6A0_9EURY|nr:hypothetical protein AKJ43_02780 [candidate division MSBL1 archaeon SCGC-AAA261D19]